MRIARVVGRRFPGRLWDFWQRDIIIRDSGHGREANCPVAERLADYCK